MSRGNHSGHTSCPLQWTVIMESYGMMRPILNHNVLSVSRVSLVFPKIKDAVRVSVSRCALLPTGVRS